MPTSPSDNGGNWRRPRSSISANPKRQRPPEDDKDVDDNPNPNSNVNANGKLQYTAVVSRKLDRIPPFVMAAAMADGDGAKQRGLKLENLSYGQLQALSYVPAENAVLAMAGDQESSGLYVVTPPPIKEGRGVVKRFWNGKVHVVPMHADWFCPTRVHRMEKQAVPRFFSGKSADHEAEKYMEFRNLIVAKYMEHPDKRLSINDLCGMAKDIDDEDINRMFSFLECWGIINYCAPMPDHKSWNIDSYLREDANGEVYLPLAALKSADSLLKFDKPKCGLKASDVYSSKSSVSSNDDNISVLENRIQENMSEHHCSYCSQPLLLVYYQSVKECDVMLCLDCYHEGRFVIGYSSIDFSRVDSTKDHGDLDADSWTDQETVLLLEALEKYNDNWHEIAVHVGSKSKAECILHFLRLPVEDGFLSNLDVPLSPTTSNFQVKDETGGPHLDSNGHPEGDLIQDSDSYDRLPFMNSGNPVMSLVAFLASSVGPRVAAACAHASLATLAEDEGIPPSETSVQVDGTLHSNTTLEDGSHGEIRNSGQHEEVSPVSAEKVNTAAKAGLVAASIKAKLFADHEEREIQRLTANIVNHQLKRLELKLKQFAEVESLLMSQIEQYEKARQRFAAERAIYMASQSAPVGVPSTMSPSGVTPLMANSNNTLTSNRPMQQLMSASPPSQQPILSGFGNQMNHPNMPFMQRPVNSFGPRLPFSALQPSSSSQSPNAMFNAQGTGQSSFSHPMLRPVPGTRSGLG